MTEITNIYGKFVAVLTKCSEICENKLDKAAKEQQRFNDYKAKNPDNILQLNAWQTQINNDVDETEFLISVFKEVLPELWNAESNRQFLKGREFEKNDGKSPFISFFRNDQEKEAIRHYSIAKQRLIDNI